jgi:hypothetical protein
LVCKIINKPGTKQALCEGCSEQTATFTDNGQTFFFKEGFKNFTFFYSFH